MQRFYLTASLLVLVLGCASSCLADSASILIPITATGFTPADSAPALAADSSGRVMVVYLGKGADNKWKLYCLLNAGGAWQQSAVPTPDVGPYPSMLVTRQLVSRTPEDGFHLLASYYSRLYYWHWKNGSWSAYSEVTTAGASGAAIALDASNQPLIARASARFRLYRQVGAAWQETVLPATITQHAMPAIYTAASGLPRLFGLSRKVPLVATQLPGHDLGTIGDWLYFPPGTATAPGATTGWTSPAPPSTSHDHWALDWPHQRTYAAWPLTNSLQVASAPVGATTAAAWQSSALTFPAHTALRSDGLRVVSSGYGAVALVYECLADGAPSLHFHWLSPTGPGPDLNPVRPGTQTEASVFTTMAVDSLGVSVTPSGTALLVVKAVKRGEIPANASRLFYGTVTGGGSTTSDPNPAGSGGATGGGTTGGGTTGGTTGGGTVGGTTDQESPKPDFTVALDAYGLAATDGVIRLTYLGDHDVMTPRLKVTNQGAQYFGDLTIKAEFDGVTLNITLKDESGHKLPLFTRGQSKTLYLPRLSYQTGYQSTPPPTYTFTYGAGDRPQTVKLYTGLGRKHMSVTVDSAEAIDEADEANNAAGFDYLLYDGRGTNDRTKVGTKYTYGLNDVALTMPRLLGNTQLLTAGYVQRPTQFDVLVVNPRLAGVFPEIPVVLYLDGHELARQTVDQLDRVPNLILGLMGPVRYYGQKPKPDTAGVMLHFPVDLTAVAEGNHTLKVVVDPDDKFADLERANNTLTLTFKVRPPGGTVRVHAKDFMNASVPVAHALVSLQDLWVGWTDAQGLVTIPDVPAGVYNNKALCGAREFPLPRYYNAYAPAFSVVNNQPVDVTLTLERSITLVGEVRVAGTGALLTDEGIGVAIADANGLCLGALVTGSHYRIEDVPPGPHKIIARAYGYLPLDTTTTAARVAGDECHLDLTLTDGPRGTVTGTVQEKTSVNGTPRALAGALVWLQNAPRGAETDAQGHYTVTRVATGQADTLSAMAQNHTDASAEVPALTTDQTLTAPTLVLPQIQQKLATIDFDATTWAICEEAPAMGDIAAIKVDTKMGAFKGALGLMSHTAVGSTQAHADYLLLWIEGGNFVQGGVSSTIGIDSLTGVDLDTLKVGPMKDLIGGLGKVFTVIEGINKLADWLYGDLDPSMIHRNNEITATYTTHTGTEYAQSPLINIPTSTDIPVAMTFVGGGTTVVRVDHIILSDSSGQRKRIQAEWYSPGFAVFKLDSDIDLPSSEIKLEVAVLNDRLSSGLLGNASRNLIDWKPGESHWLRISGYNYPD